jgi:hypothetical protein
LSEAREQIAAALPPAVVAEERQVLERISTGQAALRARDLTGTGRRTLLAAVAADEERLTAVRLRLATDHGRLAESRYPHLWTVEELQRRWLAPDEALVSFFIGEQRSTAWIVKAHTLDVVDLPGAAVLEAVTRPLLAALRDPASDVRMAAGPFERMVIPALTKAIKLRRLVVVPHGILSYVPFEALADPDGTLLVERHAISYAPSASSYAYLRGQPAASGTRVVAIGNPLMEGSGVAERRSGPIDRIGWLKPLPYAGEELRALAGLFPGASLVLERERATEQALDLPDVARAAILHFATHGVVDETRPERSGLALTSQSAASDGILQTREVYRLTLHAALVTLSACETALGKNVTGEGMVGLSRAFFYAGANAVMASLWDVNDRSTALFMTQFYGAVAGGATLDEATRTAKRAFLAGDPKFRHPYYWAPFIVTGNAAVPVYVASTPVWRRSLPLAVHALLMAAALTTLALRRRVSVGST